VAGAPSTTIRSIILHVSTGEDIKMHRHRVRFDRSLLRRITSALAAVTLTAGLLLPATDIRAQNATRDDKIIVSGASGQLGGLTVKELLARGVPATRLILVSRTPDELKEYADLGASVRFGDFTKPESLRGAYEGGARMLLISVGGTPTEPASVLLKRAIDAAKAAGVSHVAYTSYVGITRGDIAGRAADHQQTEDILKTSGVAWTMLRNSIYMDGLIAQGARMVADGRAVVPPNEHKIGYVTRADCAAAAAAVLTTPGHENQAYDITGPELLGVRETAATAQAVTGKPIEVVAGGPDTRPGFGRPAMSVTTDHFESLTGRPPTSLRALFESNKQALR
jgi:NAD(P)H dehydrogenase (quinone)